MNKQKIIDYAKKIEYNLTYFETTHDEARVLESKEYAKLIIKELQKD